MKLQITFDTNALSDGATLNAARKAFGDTFVDRYKYRSRAVNLVVTADQLVHFQILRDDLGGTNLWKALKVRSLDPLPLPSCEPDITVDVRPRCCR